MRMRPQIYPPRQAEPMTMAPDEQRALRDLTAFLDKYVKHGAERRNNPLGDVPGDIAGKLLERLNGVSLKNPDLPAFPGEFKVLAEELKTNFHNAERAYKHFGNESHKPPKHAAAGDVLSEKAMNVQHDEVEPITATLQENTATFLRMIGQGTPEPTPGGKNEQAKEAKTRVAAAPGM